MTPNDIRQEVAAIGNTTVADIEDNAFYSAINRALDRANRLQPITKSVSIYNHSLPAAQESRRAIEITLKTPCEIKGESVAAIYLNTNGACTVTVYADGIKVKTVEMPIGDRELRLTLKKISGQDYADVRILITTTSFASLVSYALWCDKYSDDEAYVPDTGIYNTYMLRSLANDFQTLKRVYLIDEQGEQVLDATNYVIASNRELWLLRSRTGRYKIEYAPICKKLSRDNLDEEIGVDPDIEQLIVLLTAYWVWYEDLNEIAENCYAQYMQLAAEIKAENRVDSDPSPKDVYGW